VDAAAADFPLTIRSRRPGDRFHPLGGPGRQRLKEFLRAEGVPEAERDAVPLVVDASGRIVWVAGLRIAHWARVTPETRRVLRLELLPR
jgi:tRNA(Ile)-lysidine synthase